MSVQFDVTSWRARLRDGINSEGSRIACDRGPTFWNKCRTVGFRNFSGWLLPVPLLLGPYT